MEYRAFQYGVDNRYINAILEGTDVARYGTISAEEWFCQRFEQNPLGKAVLACAFDGDRLVSCVAVERSPVQYEGKSLVGGYTHVLFVQKEYDTQDMWVGLLKVLEDECVRQGIDLVMGFNDQNLFAYAQGLGWKYRQGMTRYQFNSVTGLWRSIFKLLDLEKPFIADVKRDLSEGVQKETLINVGIPDYYKWLIHTSNNQFVVVDNKEVCAVLVMGLRGKRVREAQVCYFEPKRSVNKTQRCLTESLKEIVKEDKIDVVSCVDGKNYLLKSNSIRMSQKVDYYYKWLGKPADLGLDGICIDGFYIEVGSVNQELKN